MRINSIKSIVVKLNKTSNKFKFYTTMAPDPKEAKSIYEFSAKDIDDKEVSFEKYKFVLRCNKMSKINNLIKFNPNLDFFDIFDY